MTAPRCPQVYQRHSRWLSVREWRALGRLAARPDAARQRDGEPDRARRARMARAILLTTNYRAILDYNCSNFYAISVGVLADAIARR